MAQNDSTWQRMMDRRPSRRSILRGGALGIGLTGLTAIACGGGGDKGTTSNATSASGTQSAGVGISTPSAAIAANAVAVPAGNFKTGGTLSLQFDGPIGLDPYENSSYRSQTLAGYAYPRLMRFLTGTEAGVFQSHKPVGDLAETVETTPDGLQYTFKLRKNAMIHPPISRNMTAEDVKTSFDRFSSDTKNTNSSVFKDIIDTLTTPDDSTVVMKLKAPYSPMLNKLANPQYLWLMPKELNAGTIDPSKQMVGAGPWQFVSGTATAYTFKKHPEFFIKGIPYADGAVLNIIPDTATQEAQFTAGKLDTVGIAAADVESIKKQVPKANVGEFTDNLLSFIFFTRQDAPDNAFKDVRVRRAVSMAIDRDGLIDVAYNGTGAWSNLINPGLGKWHLDPKGSEIGDIGKYFKKDPQAAKQLLAAAGHANTEFKFIYPNNSYGDVYNASADAARGMLADAGFKVQVVTVDYQKDYINNGQGIFFKGAPANSIVYALQTRFTDPDDYLAGMLSPTGNRNHGGIDDPKLNDMLAKERQEINEDKRVQLVHDIQKQVDDQMYYSPNAVGKVFTFHQPWLENRFLTNDYAVGAERIAYLSINK